jgi:hypothetical protein
MFWVDEDSPVLMKLRTAVPTWLQSQRETFFADGIIGLVEHMH